MLESRTVRWSAATAGVCVLVLVVTWFLLVSPRRAEAAELRSQTEQAESRAAALQQQIALLTAQFGDLDKKKQELAALRTQLPTVADVPRLVRSLRKNADESGVDLDTITPSAPVALTGTSGQAAASGVVAVPISLDFTGKYLQSTLYLKYLQTRLQRSFLITGIQLGLDGEGAAGGSGAPEVAAGGLDVDVKITVTAQVFALPDTTAAAAGTGQAATPGATGATGTTGTAGGTAGTTGGAGAPSTSTTN